MNVNLLAPFTKRRVALAFGLSGLAVFVGFLWFSFSGSSLITFGERTVEFVFPSGLNVVPRSSEVRVSGLEVGKVKSVRVGKVDGKNNVIVTASIDGSVDLRADARAELGLKSLLGEKMVNLVPGKAQPPLEGNQIKATVVGADATQLASGGPDSARLYNGLGHDVVFDGLNMAANVTPTASDTVRKQIADLRASTDALVAGQPDLLRTIDNVETLTAALVDTQDSIGAIIDAKQVMEQRVQAAIKDAQVAFARLDTAVQVTSALLSGHQDGINEVVQRLNVAITNGQEAYRMFEAGRMIPANLFGLGWLLDSDRRQPGPNPSPPYPKGPMPTEEELEAQ